MVILEKSTQTLAAGDGASNGYLFFRLTKTEAAQ